MSDASYKFGPFIAERTTYRVLRDGQPLDLTPKLLDLLFFLLDHAGDLVTKETLLDALWPDANVTENALAQAMSELRQALGDDANAPDYIKTVARRGYRLITAVTAVEAVEPAPRPAASGGGRTIAVMDFTNVTGDADSAWLALGIAETVTGDLHALGHFRVIDRRRVTEAVRRTNGSLEDVAADLHASLAVVGSFQRHGDRIRITARVLDVSRGEAVADAKVDGPIGDIFALQDAVVAQFSQELGVPAAQATRTRSSKETPSLEAFRAFSEASVRLESLDVRELPLAIADFERAAAADPRYALAFSGLANAELAFYETTRADNAPALERLEQAVSHARHAVGLDDTLAEAHSTLAFVLVSQWRPDEAAIEARRAVALEPSNWRHLFRLGHATWGEPRLRAAAATLSLYPDLAFAHFQMAMVHVARGHLSEAETVLRQGAAVQDRQIGRGGRYPALGLHWLLGLVRLAQGDVADAIVELDREHDLAETHRLYGREYAMAARHARGAARLRANLPAEAIADFNEALALYPDHAPSHLGLALAHIAAGSPAAAEAAITRAGAAINVLARTRPVEAAMVTAQMCAVRDDADGAVASLNRLLAGAPAGFAAWTLPVEPFFWQLRASAGFAGILGRLADRAR